MTKGYWVHIITNSEIQDGFIQVSIFTRQTQQPVHNSRRGFDP
jgi:hypothetical protein